VVVEGILVLYDPERGELFEARPRRAHGPRPGAARPPIGRRVGDLGRCARLGPGRPANGSPEPLRHRHPRRRL
jgi:hypothetical protein